MENLWNVKDLESPPVNTYKEEKCNINLKLLRKTLQKGHQFFLNQGFLNEDAALLSRLIFRMKMKFRHTKDFKMLTKTNRVLLNFLAINISSSLKALLELIPAKGGPHLYLPTRNILDYVLVRLQGLAKLMLRMEETTHSTVYILQDRIRRGDFWTLGVVELGLVTRLHMLAKKVIFTCCDTYKKLLPYRKKLKNNENVWLPEGYKFPKDLATWLNRPDLDVSQTFTNEEAKESSQSSATIETMDLEDT